MYVTVFNPSDSPILVDNEGRTVGGGEWAAADSTEDPVRDALADGRLQRVSAPEPDANVNPDAKDAFERATRYGERSDQISGHDKSALDKLAIKHGVITEGEDVKVGELRRRLIAADVDLSNTRKAPSSAPKEGK